MSNTIAYILTHPAHYRLHYYRKLHDCFGGDFYFGSEKNITIKKLDYKELKGFKGELRTLQFKNFLWMISSIRLSLKYKSIYLAGNPWILSNWLIMLFARLTNRKVYLHTHGWYGTEGKIKTIIKRMYFGLGNTTFLYGNRARELMIKKGFDPQKLVVIYNSLDFQKQLLVRDKIEKNLIENPYPNLYEDGGDVLIFIGRLTNEKKLKVLMQAHKLLIDMSKNIKVFLIGDGVAGDELKRMVDLNPKQKNLVYFLGSEYREEEIGKYLYYADLCVSPGFIGLTAMHAMVYGTPVASHSEHESQAPEVEAIREGRTGFLFLKDNPNDLAKNILQWLEENKNKRDQIRRHCYKEIASTWNVDNQVNILRKYLS